MSESEIKENKIISKETTETLKMDKKKKQSQKDLLDKIKDIIYALLIFLSRFL